MDFDHLQCIDIIRQGGSPIDTPRSIATSVIFYGHH